MLPDRKNQARRLHENFDAELAMTSDMYQIANEMACRFGWRLALRAVFYVAMRVDATCGRKALVCFLSDDQAGW